LSPSPDATIFSGLEIAHRGDSLSHPENTLEAITAAAVIGAQAVEIDIMLTKDNVPVLMHDATVDRTTNGQGRVEDLSFAEIRSLYITDESSKSNADLKIPSLEEAIEVILEKKLKLEIELKTDISNKYLASKIVSNLFQKHNLFETAFVSSFDPRFLYYIRDMDERIITSLALKQHPPYNKLIEFILRRDWITDYLGVGLIEPEQFIADEKFINKWQKKGMVLNVWTVNSKLTKDFYRKHNVSITTDCALRNC